MEKYDYYEAVKEDLKRFIIDEYDPKTEEDVEDLDWQDIYDSAMVDDGVTGNASGSYTFNSWNAEENVCHNLELLGEACDQMCCDFDILKDGAETCDVTIRCYVLGQVIDEVLDELKEELPEEEDDD